MSLSSCAHLEPQIDSFCQVYSPIIVQKGDGTITASPGVKKRLLINEKTYRQICKAKAS